MENPFKIENSTIKLSDSPGLGVEIKEDALRVRRSHEQPKRSLRMYYEESP